MAEYVLAMTGEAVNAALTKAQTDVSFSQAQSLTDAQKAIARNNIGAMENRSVVEYTTQSLNDQQKQIARQNIDAGSAADVTALDTTVSALQIASDHKLDYTQIQTLTDEQQSQTRINIGLNPVASDASMTMSVGIDENGQLWAESFEEPDITNWEQVAQIVKSGAAPKFFEVGDQFIVNKATSITASVSGNITGATVSLPTFITKMNEAEAKSYTFSFINGQWVYNSNVVVLSDYGITITGTPANLDTIVVTETVEAITFDVLDFDYDTPVAEGVNHTMSLLAHDVYGYNEIVFDPREAFYYCKDGLSSGTYYFNMGEQPWFDGDVGKNMQFTLTKAVPIGGQLVMNQNYNATLIGSTISSFSSGIDNIELERVTISEGNTGTNLGTITRAINDVFNSVDRAVSGSNNWEQSSYRRYLNSDTAGAPSNTIASWYGAPATNWDRPAISTKPGFLYGLDPSFVRILQMVKKRTALNTITDNGGHVDLNEKVFLISKQECNLGTNGSINEASFGTDKTFTTIKTTPYALYVDAGNVDRIKYQQGHVVSWRFRSPFLSSGHVPYCATTSGSIGYAFASGLTGIAPALCIG